MNRDDIGNFFIGMAVGLAIGSAIGILFAPQAGKETREQIKKKVADLKFKIKPTLDKLHRK